MTTWIAAYACTAVVFFALDGAWLAAMATRFYKAQLGELMRDSPDWGVAVAFYALYVVGIVIFAVAPALRSGSAGTALLYGALFGFFAYATYDLTNLATIRGFPAIVAVVDIAWGTVGTALSAAGGFLLLTRVLRLG